MTKLNLQEGQALELLSLRDNRITLSNVKLIAAIAVAPCRTLRELDLGSEREKLTDALKENRSLTSISLEGNQIGDEGRQKL